MNETTDVVIAGGGLVGGTLAWVLSRQGHRVTLIERAANVGGEQPSALDVRTVALNYQSIQLLDQWGLWAEVRGASPMRCVHVSEQGRLSKVRLRAEAVGLDALGYVCENHELLRVIYAALARSGVELIQPAQVQSATQDEDGVTVQWRVGDVTQTRRAAILVGADGRFSSVRTAMQIGARDYVYGQTGVVANVAVEKPADAMAFERFTPQGPLAFLPMTESRYAVIWTLSPEQAEAVMQWGDEQFLDGLQRAFGWRFGRMTAVGRRLSFPLEMTVAERDVDGRMVLLGNAAHTLHPIAGQGLNLSLRDVAVLAEVLEAGIGPERPPARLLSRYSQRRFKDQRQTLYATDALNRLFSNDHAGLGLLRQAAMTAVGALPPLRNRLMQQTLGLIWQ